LKVPYPATLAQLIDVPAECAPERTALIDASNSWTYRDLDLRANQIANGLLEHGSTTGTRIAVLIGNEGRYIETLLGIWRAGAIAVIPNTRLSPEQIAGQVSHSNARIVLASHELADTASMIAARNSEVLTIAGASYDHWRVSQEVTRPDIIIPVDEICLQSYTSGSTGEPKGALLTHSGQLHNARTVAKVDLLCETDRAVISAPVFHAGTMAAAVLPVLLVGGSLVILPKFAPKAVAESIAHYRCTFMTGVPSMYSAMLRDKSFESFDVRSLQFLNCGSAPVTVDLIQRLESVLPGVPVLEGYGLTEGGPVVTKSPRFGPKRTGSIGMPLPGVAVRIVDARQRSVRTGEVGELVVRSPGAAVGYHNNSSAFAARLTDDGWLRTGDLAYADSDGFLYYRGRLDDMMNVSGENVYPQAVETLIREYPGIDDVAVVPAPHSIKGQIPVAFVVVSSSLQFDARELQQFCLENGPSYAYPRNVVVLDTLPVGSTGKIDRRRLAEEAADSVSSTSKTFPLQ
jgi:long-chain acyl-CoA synthetase